VLVEILSDLVAAPIAVDGLLMPKDGFAIDLVDVAPADAFGDTFLEDVFEVRAAGVGFNLLGVVVAFGSSFLIEEVPKDEPGLAVLALVVAGLDKVLVDGF
jgi:hypothetical protein